MTMTTAASSHGKLVLTKERTLSHDKTHNTTFSTGSSESDPLYPTVSPVPAEREDWEIPRFSDLEKKRLSLCQQRVRLERQLFEVSRNHPIPTSQSGGKRSDMNGSVSKKMGSPALQNSSLETDDKTENTDAHHVTRLLVRFDRGYAHWTGPVHQVEEEIEETSSGFTTKTIQTVLKPNGNGIMEYSNGQVYEGNIVNGQRHGYGKNMWPDGQIFVGGWIENSRAGRGSHMWPDGKTVTGQWTDGHLNGRCFFQWPDGATYDGDTLNGKKHGRGVHTWIDGKIYKGQYEGGYEHGLGTLTEADGVCRYRGEFRHGQRHGYGTQIWREKTYDGEWQYNVVAGQGKLSWKNGAVYEGQFVSGRFDGIGCYTDKTGRKYVGSWVQGQKEGQGRETWPQTGQVYVGSYRHGKKHGFGRLGFANGSIYAGGWRRGKRSGRGIHLKPNGDILHCGLWENDKPILSDRDIELMSQSPSSLSSKAEENEVDELRPDMYKKVSFAEGSFPPKLSVSREDAKLEKPSRFQQNDAVEDDFDVLLPFVGQKRIPLRTLPGQTKCHHDTEFSYLYLKEHDTDHLSLAQSVSSLSTPSRAGKSWEI